MKLSNQTQERIAEFERMGFTIIIGNDWRLGRRPKWANHVCIRLAQTNSTTHGRCIRTVWAVRPIQTIDNRWHRQHDREQALCG
jgi:hypothetical protein